MILDSNTAATLQAATSWVAQNRLEEMQALVAKLEREKVLDTLVVVRELQEELLHRLHVTGDELIAAYERELVAQAALTPDALPDNAEGFPVNGVHTQRLPERLAKPCGYCGKQDCPDRWQHERDAAGNETTWRMRRARA